MPPKMPISIMLLTRMVQVIPLLNLGHWDTLLYIALFCVAYAGCFRVSEMIPCSSPHAVTANQITLSVRKHTVIGITVHLHSHKHSKSYPIPVHLPRYPEGSCFVQACPVRSLYNFLALRGRAPGYFFIRQHGFPPTRDAFAKLIKLCVEALGLDASLFDTHSFRIGRCSDWMSVGIPASQVMVWGRWSSDAVFDYVRPDKLFLPVPQVVC